MPADHLGRNIRLELIEPAGIEQAFEHRPDVVAHTMIDGNQLVQRFHVPLWCRVGARRRRGMRQAADVLADACDAFLIVLGAVMRDGADGGVRRRTAQRFRIHDLSRGAFDEIRPAQSHERRAVDHEDHVGQRRQIRATCDAGAHDRGDLRDFEIAAHDRVVVENPGGAVLPRKDAALIGQVHTRGIDQVDDRNALPHRDLLRAQDLLDRLGPPRPGFDRRIIGHHDDRPAAHAAQARDDAGGRRLAVVLVPGDEQTDFDPRTVPVEQRGDALARGQLALIVLAFDPLRAAALFQARAQLLVFIAERLEATHERPCVVRGASCV